MKETGAPLTPTVGLSTRVMFWAALSMPSGSVRLKPAAEAPTRLELEVRS